ncbi:alpha/beta hydrolase [uncultured Croceitalea sp.]|uniref:alpha/beta hydrolase n=1 Tax=uncultured Croceitalea sp. TaxID=1798908 RepID=UPI00330638B8
MKKRYLPLLVLFLFCLQFIASQELRLQKGTILDSIVVQDTINETFALYLPKSFEMKSKWPLLMVFDMKGRGSRVLGMFKEAAEAHGYILAAPNNLNDSLSITKNIVSVKMVLNRLGTMFPIHKSRMYTAGYQSGGRFANLVPIFIKPLAGAVSISTSVANLELLNSKRPFHLVNIVSAHDFNYTTLLEDEKLLNRLKFPNNMLVFETEDELPDTNYLKRALWLFNLSAMAKGNLAKDEDAILKNYDNEIKEIERLKNTRKLLLAERLMLETITAYRNVLNTDSLRNAQKNLRKEKMYRNLKRVEGAALFKENLKREDYSYYLEEDVLTYNFKNLGWWTYQMTQINGFINGDDKSEQRMGKRLLGFLNALVDDNATLVEADEVVDEEALLFLRMLKTITEPNVFEHYFEVVSLSAKNDDYGTSLFYLEEVLKKGFKDKDKLYALEHTNLLRITPEFNTLVEKYLKGARYEIKEE